MPNFRKIGPDLEVAQTPFIFLRNIIGWGTKDQFSFFGIMYVKYIFSKMLSMNHDFEVID